MRRKLQLEIAEHKHTTGAGTADVHASNQPTATPELTLKRVDYALYVIDPTKYPYKWAVEQSVVNVGFGGVVGLPEGARWGGY